MIDIIDLDNRMAAIIWRRKIDLDIKSELHFNFHCAVLVEKDWDYEIVIWSNYLRFLIISEMRLHFTTLIVVILAISFVEAGKANGKKCFKSKKCNSGHCCKIPGKIFKQCQECCRSQDCSGGKVCTGFNCVLPTAVGSKKPNGGKCTNGSECNSGHCCGRVWPFKGMVLVYLTNYKVSGCWFARWQINDLFCWRQENSRKDWV